MIFFCFVTQEVEQDAKTTSKNIIPSGSYDFFFNLAHNTITMRLQTSNRDILKRHKEYFLRKPYKLEVSNLVVMLLSLQIFLMDY